jgi:hypothetical protein
LPAEVERVRAVAQKLPELLSENDSESKKKKKRKKSPIYLDFKNLFEINIKFIKNIYIKIEIINM